MSDLLVPMGLALIEKQSESRGKSLGIVIDHARGRLLGYTTRDVSYQKTSTAVM